MKNVIAYYYNLNSYDIRHIDNEYNFELDNNFYKFIPINGNEINSAYEISMGLQKFGIYTHQIIPNINNQLTTQVDEKLYVLLKAVNKMDKKAELSDIIYFNNLTEYYSSSIIQNFTYIKWNDLWSKKIDYYEYQINQFGKKYPLLKESFSFFSGIVECGISLISNINPEIDDLIISHKRLTKNSTLYDIYNPFNMIIDSKVRDIAEYFKNLFLKDDYVLESIIYYLQQNNLTSYEYLLFFLRMFYPSFYFDLYDKIIDNELSENNIVIAIKKGDDYILLLKKLYNYLKNYIAMPDIEWLK